ncbi:MAG: universal stress protein [Desulfobacterales bacterium]|nr:universal stress protein [Desulfobacterales bacterium]
MTFQTIACCTDFSPNAEVAVFTAVDLAEKYGATLKVLHVVPPPVNPVVTDFDNPLYGTLDYDEEVDRNMVLKVEEKLQDRYGAKISSKVEVDYVVLTGHISSEVLSYLKENEIDLVVLGSYGLSGMGLVIFGSVAKRVAHKATCSVMIARPAEEVQK